MKRTRYASAVKLLSLNDAARRRPPPAPLVCWSLSERARALPISAHEPSAILDEASSSAQGLLTGDRVDEPIAPAAATITAALGRVLDVVCDHVATDAGKGIGPFARGGIAGPWEAERSKITLGASSRREHRLIVVASRRTPCSA